MISQLYIIILKVVTQKIAASIAARKAGQLHCAHPNESCRVLEEHGLAEPPSEAPGAVLGKVGARPDKWLWGWKFALL